MEPTTVPDPDLLVLGISHATAPLHLLERLYEAPEPLDDLVSRISATEGFAAAAVLSTCNRMEVYVEAAPSADAGALAAMLAEHTGVSPAEITPYHYAHTGRHALRHLFQVASGLDSVVLGEDQILGQLKEALERSQRAGSSNKGLNQAFQTALRVGKRARNETGLNEAGRSLATAGLAFFERLVGSLAGKTALVIGAGSFGGVVLAALRRSGLETVHLANRTPDKAQRLAETAGGTGYSLEEVPRLLTEVDVVVSCTAATEPLVGRPEVERAMALRGGRELYLLDLSLPRNIDPAVAEVPGAVLVDLQRIAQDGSGDELSVASVATAHEIVDAEVESFAATRRVARATPILATMRATAQEATTAELARLTKRLDTVDDRTQAEISQSVRRIVDKMLHLPTVRVRQLAGAPDGAVYVDALGKLFAPENRASDAQEVMV
ncbi:glutamyl-tRNA reductase [Streptomyces sp. NPDC092296]|uniref:glutamyl-tRNA reductase n=1 Tax=Streptomyces sp. NPDC092296 TaxID=3366012 RepID=UPI00382E0EBE